MRERDFVRAVRFLRVGERLIPRVAARLFQRHLLLRRHFPDITAVFFVRNIPLPAHLFYILGVLSRGLPESVVDVNRGQRDFPFRAEGTQYMPQAMIIFFTRNHLRPRQVSEINTLNKSFHKITIRRQFFTFHLLRKRPNLLRVLRVQKNFRRPCRGRVA